MLTDGASRRLAGLDLFRGVAVAFMIIVNTPGSADHVWWPLDHAAWNGFTPTDLVFPAFLFAIGTAIALSFPRTVTASTWLRIARRTLALLLLGWAIQWLARGTLDHFRLMGVLPRIALCYALASALAIGTSSRLPDDRLGLRGGALLAAAGALLAVYTLLMLCLPVPGHGAGQLSPEGNLAGYVDRLVLTPAHMWRFGTDATGHVVYDPEGLFSTLPALANVLFGMMAGLLWQRHPGTAIRAILTAGFMMAMLGLTVTPIFPLNKKLWSTSFALLTSGLSALLLASAMMAAAAPRLRRLLEPLRALGMNAILAYVLSLLLGILGMRRIAGVVPQTACFDWLNRLAGDPWLASVLYAVLVLAIVLAVIAPMHRRGLYLRL